MTPNGPAVVQVRIGVPPYSLPEKVMPQRDTELLWSEKKDTPKVFFCQNRAKKIGRGDEKVEVQFHHPSLAAPTKGQACLRAETEILRH